MRNFNSFFGATVICAAGWLMVSGTVAAGPVVTKVEPPNWWAGHSLGRVRLLVSGSELRGARVEAPAGFSASAPKGSTNGTYLFVDLSIPPAAKPGPVPLRVSTSSGETVAAFSLEAALPAKGRFAGFSPDDVIYLLMPDRFANGDPGNDNPAAAPGLCDRSQPRHYHGGDFKGVLDHLPYLRKLGVTALWMTPWYDNVNHFNQLEKYTADNQRSKGGRPSTDYHGYGAVDFYGMEEHFGSLSELRALVKAAHADGLKVIQDQVANHTGPYHAWTTNSPTPTWYNGTVANHLENTWQTWTIADPNPPADKFKSTLEGWFINLLPDLNQNDVETATYLIQNSLWWVGMTGLDAVRQDTLPYVPRSYWSQWTSALKRQYPKLTILGEMWDGNPKLVSFFQGGRARFDGVDSGVDTLFDFPMHYALRDVFAKGQRMSRLSETLAADTNYVNPRGLVTFLGLHDTPRFMNESGATVAGLKLGFTCLLTMRGTPLIYYGDEIAMPGGGDPDNRRDFPGGWKEDARNAFTEAGRTPEQQEVFAHVQKLLGLRQQCEPLRRGEVRELLVEPDAYAYARATAAETVIVAINNAAQPRAMEVALGGTGLASSKALTDRLGALGKVAVQGQRLSFTLPARSGAIFSR